jgi:hypothetical protein
MDQKKIDSAWIYSMIVVLFFDIFIAFAYPSLFIEFAILVGVAIILLTVFSIFAVRERKWGK